MINYDVNNLGGNTWEYTYTVQNDSLAVDIEEFTIWFDLGLYENLTPTSTLIDWDEITIQPDIGLPDDGYYDALALVSGIAPGSSETGFSVSFDWLGTGTPGSQFFEIVDTFTFSALDSGDTTLVSSDPVPEPSTVMLMGIGLIGLTVISLRFKKQKLVPLKEFCKETRYRNT
jgi:PEP-CTERM putative exosortase interaction domain